MNDTSGTRLALIAAGRELFATHGYRGASIRAITTKAGANLGSVTYHFGSKQNLYGAVLGSVIEPFRDHLAEVAQRPGTPPERIEHVVQAFFRYLQEHPALPALMVQHLASSTPFPEGARRVLEGNLQLLAGIIALGQLDGSIRQGDPRLMALSIVAQPIWLTLVRRLLREAIGFDQQDPRMRAALVDSVLDFVRAALAPPLEQA
jgi:AcrR family transcriptional regulator